MMKRELEKKGEGGGVQGLDGKVKIGKKKKTNNKEGSRVNVK